MYRLFAEEDPYMRLARKICRGRSIYEILKKKINAALKSLLSSISSVFPNADLKLKSLTHILQEADVI